ncbi:hypothetical protein BH23ACT3_BH23ACT3_22390 [soil metagenome]
MDAHLPDAHLLAEARLDAAVSLAVFRTALSAMSRPGRVERLPDAAPASIPAALLVPLALADLEVAVAVLDHPPDDGAGRASWAELVRTATGARLVSEVAAADLVVAQRAPTPYEVSTLRTGDAVAPEKGARLVLACAALRRCDHEPHDSGVQLRLTGPGAASGRTVCVEGVEPAVFAALRETNRSFPAGVDTWLVADDGSVIALPRSAHVEVRLAAHATGVAPEAAVAHESMNTNGVD